MFQLQHYANNFDDKLIKLFDSKFDSGYIFRHKYT